MALSSGQVGANLVVWKGAGLSKRLGMVMNQFFRMLGHIKGTTPLGDTPNFAIFVKIGVSGGAGDVVADNAADSPGRNLCFVWDRDGANLWFVYDWVSATSFKVLKVID